ncbi:uncharacterized protein TRIADDRAFT_24158 [Trichoplax adhaerens]|uniref:Sodium/nucleoside cotransporter n=1 Tax=Trichoplax adhaerens TaxID=10228 RepID=B3RUT9_TRIAD|nr:hypothetical protein TRIADDRAFT_24158 [Trichoplax adhaerens]EDV25882.1 hypothetical protein TRIADDRAFT_24158 [Trichoplax adhaerens]|eukprot:XP_002111915.1 hypothetical protein TRIADDRAFT_24158 [Trichoplax adhaerens]
MEENKADIRKISLRIFLIALLAGYVVFLVFACTINFERAKTLFIITMVILGLVVFSYVWPYVSPTLWKFVLNPISYFYGKHQRYLKWFVYYILLYILVLFLVLDQPIIPYRFASFGGLLVYLLICWIFSKHRSQVRWRPVIVGFIIQFIMGLLILRTTVGFQVFQFLGNLITTFLNFTDSGSKFVFGDLYTNHFFAFKVLPLVIFFSAVISFLYYIGVMQVVIKVISRMMQISMKTSPTESLNAAGNIFVGQTEAPLLVRPFLAKMTKSELHAVMTGGFATIAGSVLGAYIGLGVPATHLLTASFMSAPAALAVAKLVYPETEKDEEYDVEDIKLERGTETNFFEALSNGASTAVPLVANIAANLIVFTALLNFLDGLLGYFGSLVNYPLLSFRLICSYLFTPLALLLGIEYKDAFNVGLLLAEKTVANEFVAYITLSKWINARIAGNPVISVRSEVISAYALCGFANFSSIGIQIGGLSPMAPERKGDLASIAFRALCSGTVACFMTACLAGKTICIKVTIKI